MVSVAGYLLADFGVVTNFWAQRIGQSVSQSGVAFLEGIETGTAGRLRRGFVFGETDTAADDAAAEFVGLVDFRERCSQAQFLRITRVNPGDKRTYEAVQKFLREFCTNEACHGF